MPLQIVGLATPNRNLVAALWAGPLVAWARLDQRCHPRTGRLTSQHRIHNTHEDIVEACCAAWNDLVADPARITSIASRDWANVS